MGKPKAKDCLEDPGIYRMVILTWILQKYAVNCMDCIHLAWNKIKWWAPVMTVLNVQVP